MEKFVDLLHDRAQNLVELQRRREGFSEFVENGYFSRLPMLGREAGISSALDACKKFAFGHFFVCQWVPVAFQLKA
jgi:hypothetical protein